MKCMHAAQDHSSLLGLVPGFSVLVQCEDLLLSSVKVQGITAVDHKWTGWDKSLLRVFIELI